MLTGKKLVDTLTAELGEIGMGNMASELDAMYRSPEFLELDLLSAIARLVETEYQARTNKRITNRLRAAHLLGCPQDITSCVDSSERAYLPAGITETLSTLAFLESGLNVCVLGPSDSGKSYLAKAIGIVACTKYRVGYFHCEDLLESLDLLVLDDFLLHTLTDEREVKLLFEILEKRSEMKLSTFICSQRDPKSWSAMILNDEVSANAILKRATKHFTVLIRPKSAT